MDENIINYMNNIENTNLSEEDKEFEKYLKLFKEKKEDILDQLLYSSSDKFIY